MAPKRKVPHTFVIVFFLIILAAIATWIIPGGKYIETQTVVGCTEHTQSVFNYTENHPQTWQIFSALFEGFVDKSDIIIFILLIGGSFWIMNDSKALDVGILAFLRKTRRFERYKIIRKLGTDNIIITTIMLVFSVFGAVFGMSEETIAFIIILVPMSISMGYDSITGVSMVFVAAGLGFAGAILNPFTIGIAQGLSGLPLFSGIEYRMFCWFVINLVGILWILRYAQKVKKNPKSSLVYNDDKYWRERESSDTENLNYYTPKSAWFTYGIILSVLVVLSFILPFTKISIGATDSALCEVETGENCTISKTLKNIESNENISVKVLVSAKEVGKQSDTLIIGDVQIGKTLEFQLLPIIQTDSVLAFAKSNPERYREKLRVRTLSKNSENEVQIEGSALKYADSMQVIVLVTYKKTGSIVEIPIIKQFDTSTPVSFQIKTTHQGTGASATLPILPISALLFAVLGFLSLKKSVHYFIIILLLFTIIFLIVGVMGYAWYVMEIATLFLVMGISSGIAISKTADEITKLFLEGVKDILSAAMIVGLAGGIIMVLQHGQIIDTILYGLSQSMKDVGNIASVSIMYVIQTAINLVLPSGSAKAALTMPIMAPFSDLIGISRQATVMAFQLGDGFTNMITPTSGVLIAVLGVAKIPYEKWFKWVLPFIIVMVLIGFLLLIPTVTMKLNGF